MKRIFNKKSILLLIVLFIIIVAIVFILNNYNYNKINNKVEKNYQYKTFEPTFNNSYDFTHDMIYKDKIYYKKLMAMKNILK